MTIRKLGTFEGRQVVVIKGHDSRRRGLLASVIGVHGHTNYTGEFELRCAAMGIDWMDNDELSQAIPPAYTEWIGKQLMEALECGPICATGRG
jgi:hypothetical protein